LLSGACFLDFSVPQFDGEQGKRQDHKEEARPQQHVVGFSLEVEGSGRPFQNDTKAEKLQKMAVGDCDRRIALQAHGKQVTKRQARPGRGETLGD